MTVEILGKPYELAYTLEAQEEMTKKFGGVEKEQMEKIFDTTDREAFADRIAFLVSTFSAAAKHRTTVRAKMLGEKVEKTETPSDEEVGAALKVLTPAELAEVTGGILLAITVGNRGSVETKETGGKKKRRKRKRIIADFAWLKYCGLRAGLNLAEALTSMPGEIADLSACLAIDNGAVEQKKKMSFEEMMGVM